MNKFSGIFNRTFSSRAIDSVFALSFACLVTCSGCGSGGNSGKSMEPEEELGISSPNPVSNEITESVNDTPADSDGDSCISSYIPPFVKAEQNSAAIDKARRYTQFQRVSSLSESDLSEIKNYVSTPCFAFHIWPIESEALGCEHSLYHSAFARVRWPGLDHIEPSTEAIQQYVESFVGDFSTPTGGVPFNRQFKQETTNDVMARWILDNSWIDPQTLEWPVRRWLIWDKNEDDNLEWVNAPYPANGYPENPNWHNDAGNASMMWPLDPLSEVEHLRDRLDHLDAYPDYGEGGGRTVTVHLDNFNAPNGGNRPFRGWVLGNQHREAYKEMVRRMADLLHSRGMFLVVNNLRADHPQDLWDLPFDGLHKEYGYSEAELKRVRQLLKGRVFYAKNRTEMDSAEVAQRIFDNGGRPKSIWPGETRPADWFKPCGTVAGEWNLDEGKGTSANDFTFYHNHGQLRGSPQWVRGKKGSALWFDEDGDGLDIDRSNSLSITERVTVSAWIRPTRDAIDTPTGVEDVIVGPSFRIRLTPEVRPTFSIRDSDALEAIEDNDYWVDVTADRQLPLDQWTHIAATYDYVTREMILYVDGILAGRWVNSQKPLAAGDGRMESLANGVEFSGSTNPFLGQLDDVLIHRRPVNALEVKEMYDDGNLAAHWRLDEEAGEYDRVYVANDSSAWANYGIVSGGCGWVPGIKKNGLEFPGGQEDSVEIRFSESLDLGEAMTIAVWLKVGTTPSNGDVAAILDGPAYKLSLGIDNKIQFSVRDIDLLDTDADGWSTVISDFPIVNDEWVHVGCSYDYWTQELRLYIDGQPAGVRPLTPDPAACGIRGLDATPRSIYLSTTTHPYRGILDEVRIYNVALNGAQVLALTNE